MLNRENIKWIFILAYMVGAAMTYNHAMRSGRDSVAQSGDIALLMLKSMFASLAWPLYWLALKFS